MKLLRPLILLVFIFSAPAQAENMIMVRIHNNFDNSMILMKEKLNEYGYKVAHIQKCDSGLSDSGYKTGFYKSIFFGKLEEKQKLTRSYPEIIPYVPLKIVLMQENDTVVMVSLNPSTLSEFFPDKELQTQFSRWESDLRAMFEEVSSSKTLD